MGNVTPNTRAKAREVLEALYAAQGKDLMTLWGMGGPPEHSTGRAIDFMVPGDSKAGDFIADYVIANRARLGLGWVIWKQRIWNVGNGSYGPAGQWNWMENRGSWTQNHMDHPHVFFTSDAYTPKGSGPTPTPAPAPAPKPVPGKRLSFPLPKGYYFGIDDGSPYSVSGKYRRSFNGQDASWWITELVAQLGLRGWNVDKGGPYLTRWGNDGVCGAEFHRLMVAFQTDQRLTYKDGKAGLETWNAAFFNPVS